MATLTKFHTFVEQMAEKVHNLGSDSLVLWMSNTAPTASTGATISDISQITYTNASSRALTVSSSAQSSGTYKLVIADITITASGGTVGPFRYVGVYNDTAASDQLVGGYYDYGSSNTLADTETFTEDFDGTNGFFTLA